jgi:ribonucleotide monophosphatase NagD (HAD superfamily)
LKCELIYTDIASGNNAGVDTVCVLSGEVTIEEVNKAEGVLDAADVVYDFGDRAVLRKEEREGEQVFYLSK